MKNFFTLLKKFKNWGFFLSSFLLASYGAYWIVVTPAGLPFGLVRLSPLQKSAAQKQKKPQKASIKRAETMSAITEEDIAASEQDEKGGKIEAFSAKQIDTILYDKNNRISDLFAVPAELRKRVEFWFNIYSLYTISHAVIHDTDHPWIVYEVVNLNPVYDKFKKESDRRAEKARLGLEAKKRAITTLNRLSKRKIYVGLPPDEARIYDFFKDIPGSKRKLFENAEKNVRLQLGQKDSVVYAIKKSGRYLKSMEKTFSEQKLPAELTRIPFLESSFNLEAYSKDGASGIWQFMSKTGNVFLTVSQAMGIDERRDPLKATGAAAQLLKQNYKIFKEWPLAITAYNHGPGGVLQGIKKLRTKSLADLIERYEHSSFGFASKNFYSEFLAVLHVEKYQDKIFGALKLDPHLEYDDIEIQYSMRVKYVTELCHVTLDEIKRYNHDLQEKVLGSHSYLPEGYYLKLPKGEKVGLLQFYKEVEETNRLLDQMLGKEKD